MRLNNSKNNERNEVEKEIDEKGTMEKGEGQGEKIERNGCIVYQCRYLCVYVNKSVRMCKKGEGEGMRCLSPSLSLFVSF